MIVVDTNILAYLWLPCELTELAEKALRKDSSWVSVPLWRSEFRNVLAVYLRKKLISYEEALNTIMNAENQMQNSEYSINTLQVLHKVRDSNCSAYDCEYIALADALNCKFLTNDKKIVRSFPDIAVSLKTFV